MCSVSHVWRKIWIISKLSSADFAGQLTYIAVYVLVNGNVAFVWIVSVGEGANANEFRIHNPIDHWQKIHLYLVALYCNLITPSIISSIAMFNNREPSTKSVFIIKGKRQV